MVVFHLQNITFSKTVKHHVYQFSFFCDGNIDPKQVHPILPSPGATKKFGSKTFYATVVCFKNALKILHSEVHFLLKLQAVGLNFAT